MLNLDRSTWTRVRFGDIATSVTDRVDDPSAAGVDRYVGLEHLDPGSMTVDRWGAPDDVSAQKLRFQPGDVIFGRRRAYQRKVARADFEGICSAHALVLRAKPTTVAPEFLPVFLSSEYFLQRAISISVGSLSPTVNWKDLAVQEFDLPPLDKQRRIADLLWSAERLSGALRAEGTTATAAVDKFAGHLIARAPGEDVFLGDVLEISRGGSPRPIDAYFTEAPDGLNWIKIGDVRPDAKYIERTEQRISPSGLSKTRAVHPGDLLLSNSMSYGRPYILKIDGCIHDGWLLLSDKNERCDPEFLYYVLRSDVVQEQFHALAAGSAVKNLNKELVKGVSIRLPSRADQARLAGELASLDVKAQQPGDECEALRRVRNYLSSAMLEGVVQ
jgi:type I restriction enzyme S subunit